MKMALSIYVDLLFLKISGRLLFWPVLSVIPVAPKLSYCKTYQSFSYQGVFDDNCVIIFLFSLKPYVMTPDLNRHTHGSDEGSQHVFMQN